VPVELLGGGLVTARPCITTSPYTEVPAATFDQVRCARLPAATLGSEGEMVALLLHISTLYAHVVGWLNEHARACECAHTSMPEVLGADAGAP